MVNDVRRSPVLGLTYLLHQRFPALLVGAKLSHALCHNRMIIRCCLDNRCMYLFTTCIGTAVCSVVFAFTQSLVNKLTYTNIKEIQTDGYMSNTVLLVMNIHLCTRMMSWLNQV